MIKSCASLKYSPMFYVFSTLHCSLWWVCLDLTNRQSITSHVGRGTWAEFTFAAILIYGIRIANYSIFFYSVPYFSICFDIVLNFPICLHMFHSVSICFHIFPRILCIHIYIYLFIFHTLLYVSRFLQNSICFYIYP